MNGFVLGLSGKSCSGKNVFAEILTARGWLHLDMDKLGHQVLSEKSDTLIQLFGEEISNGNGGIDRKRLGGLVFADPRLLKMLEDLLHPEMLRQAAEKAHKARQQGKLLLINAAILEKTGLHMHCDAVAFIESPLPYRILRLKRRDRLSWQGIINRITSQKGINAKRLEKDVDTYTISNLRGRASLEKKAVKLEKLLLQGTCRQG